MCVEKHKFSLLKVYVKQKLRKSRIFLRSGLLKKLVTTYEPKKWIHDEDDDSLMIPVIQFFSYLKQTMIFSFSQS